MNDSLKPTIGEYDPYFDRYLSLLPEQDLRELLLGQMEEVDGFFLEKGEDWLLKPYQEGKWTPKQLLGHVSDTERVMTYRALCIGRGDLQPLPGFDENQYVDQAHFNNVSIEYLLEDFKQVRSSLMLLGHGFSQQDWERKGNANGKDISPRAIVHIVAGHFIHHMNILQERYV